MKRLFFILFLGTALVISAQTKRNPHDRDSQGNSPMQQNIDMREKIKLVEVLGLNEDTAVKFFARRNQQRDEFRKLGQERENIIDELENEIKSGKKIKDTYYNAQIKKILNVESRMAKTRENFLVSLKNLFTTEQLAKYYVFDTRYREEIRNEMMRGSQKPKK